MTTSIPPDLPTLPRDAGGPVFEAPWQAQAFAMAVKLHEAGCFTWAEWAERLAAEIKRAQARGDPDLGQYGSRDELQADYLELEDEDIRQATAYAAAMLGDESVEITTAS